eukprot:15184953-Heterocapsa_arctica.AAC.1
MSESLAAPCCRLGISGLFLEPDVVSVVSNDVCTSETSTHLASPASSVVGDESDTEGSPWDAFDVECNLETKYCEERVVLNLYTPGSKEVIPSMPCTNDMRSVLRSDNIAACASP